MRILLDTCTFIWMVTGEALPAGLIPQLRDPANELLLSAASAWEIVIKHGAGRLELSLSPTRFVTEGRRKHFIEELPMDEDAALNTALLPPHHKDPFDRMLVSQAILGGCVIATPDPLIGRYPVRTTWE